MEIVGPHYGLWVANSTGGGEHQPGSSILENREERSVSRSSRSSSYVLNAYLYCVYIFLFFYFFIFFIYLFIYLFFIFLRFTTL